jgi:nucleotide-binding universal stress UspA family protein
VQEGERSARNVAERVVEETLDEWNDVTLQGRVGEPVKEILDEAERRDASYVVIGGRKRTPVGKAIFGSTTQSLLLNAQIPVLTVMREQS